MTVNDHTAAGHAPDREGFALVTTVLVVLVLSVMAVGAAWIASSEKKTSFNEGVHISSLFSADAGGEAAINFIRTSETPPNITDFADNKVHAAGETTIQGSQAYDYDAHFSGRRGKPGWGVVYKDYDYRMDVQGSASVDGVSGVELMVSRLYKEGY